MLEGFDWKMVAGVIGLLSNVAFVPYLVDLFKRRTEPHLYTWFIWLITQGTATLAAFDGGGAWGVAGLAVGMVLVAAVFILSFWYGTKNITSHDIFVLLAALMAVFVWWQLKEPVLAVLMVSFIDVLGYLPTYRKSWSEPWSETVSAWAIFSFGNLVSLFALEVFNLQTATYLAAIMVANLILFILLLIRRRHIPRPLA